MLKPFSAFCKSAIQVLHAFETSPVFAVDVLETDNKMPAWPLSFA